MNKNVLFASLLTLAMFGSGCMSVIRTIGGGRGSLNKDKFTLLEKSGNDGRVTMTHNGQIVGQFDTPYDLAVPRSDGGDYYFDVTKAGFQPIRLKMVMKTHTGGGAGAAGNIGFFMCPPVAVLGALTDTKFTSATRSMGPEIGLEEDGDKFYYTLVPLTGSTGQQSGSAPLAAPVAGINPPVYQTPMIQSQVVTSYVDRVVYQPGDTKVIIVTNTVERFTERSAPPPKVYIQPPAVTLDTRNGIESTGSDFPIYGNTGKQK